VNAAPEVRLYDHRKLRSYDDITRDKKSSELLMSKYFRMAFRQKYCHTSSKLTLIKRVRLC